MPKYQKLSTSEAVTPAEDRVSKQERAEIDTGCGTITVLSVSPIQEDHDTLDQLLSGRRWKIQKSLTLRSGVAFLQQAQVQMVLCEQNLLPGTWRDMLAEMTVLSNPPLLVVTARPADDQLWAEALNLGAYDVLAKPFDSGELKRTLSMAWLHWKGQHEPDRIIALKRAMSA